MILTPILTLIALGVVGYLIITYVPMIEPIRIVVMLFFLLVAIVYVFKIIALI